MRYSAYHEGRKRDRIAGLRALAEQHTLTPEEENLCVGIARATANRWRRSHCQQAVDHDDLVSEAMVAAWRALLTWEPSGGASLKTWLCHACRGAVQEALRNADPLSRVERARFRLASRSDPAALPPRLFLSWEVLQQDHWDPELGERTPLLPAALRGEDERLTAMPERLDSRQLAEQALSVLSGWEREIVRRCIMGGEDLKAYAREIGCSESRVHQIRDAALRRMREAVGERR